jgi:hypothetical protein
MIGRLALRVNSRFRHIPGFDTDGAGEEDVDCTPKVSQEIKGASYMNGGERRWCPDNNIPAN